MNNESAINTHTISSSAVSLLNVLLSDCSHASVRDKATECLKLLAALKNIHFGLQILKYLNFIEICLKMVLCPWIWKEITYNQTTLKHLRPLQNTN